MTKRSFPDINVWFATAVADPVHHPAAAAWWNETGSLVGFSRITQLGLLRLLTTSATMGGMPLTNSEAWRVYDAFLADDRVRVFPELPEMERRFRASTEQSQSSPKQWADAYIAAYAEANEATLVTFDRGFEKYGVPCRILE